MNKIDNKSLIIGLLIGAGTAILVFLTAFLIITENAKGTDDDIAQNYASIDNIPLKVINKDGEKYKKEFVYEKNVEESLELIPAQKLTIDKPIVDKIELDVPLYIKNSKSVEVAKGKKQIAIIIDDVGVNVANSIYSSDNLPSEVTFSFLPYGKATQELIKKAYNNNRESMLHLPTEPMGTISPGPDAIMANMGEDEIKKITEKNVLQVLDYVVGTNNHMGSKFSSTASAVKPVLEVIQKYNMFYLDSVTTAKTVIRKVHAQENLKLPLLKRNIFLDHEQTEEFILKQLDKTKRIADANGFAIAIAHPHKITTNTLSKWAKTLKDTNYQLVPISSIVKLKADKG